VLEIGDKSNRISQMSTADAIVRNDEVVGSIPTSSTIFSVTCGPSLSQSRSISFQNIAYLAITSSLVSPVLCLRGTTMASTPIVAPLAVVFGHPLSPLQKRSSTVRESLCTSSHFSPTIR